LPTGEYDKNGDEILVREKTQPITQADKELIGLASDERRAALCDLVNRNKSK
jgi:hypothetical protein